MAVYHILIMLLHICTCPDNTVPNHSSINFVRIYIYGIDLEEVVGFLFVCLFVCFSAVDLDGLAHSALPASPAVDVVSKQTH